MIALNSKPCWLNWIERKTSNLEVLGSSPRWGASFLVVYGNIIIVFSRVRHILYVRLFLSISKCDKTSSSFREI